jgi:NAD(P)-dependent dehydrogenase (short-subunit alcohol dehydrogenase family)
MRVKLVGDIVNCPSGGGDEFYTDLPQLWARSTSPEASPCPRRGNQQTDLMKQVDRNFVSAFLCCAAAVRNMRHGAAGGRIINVATRPALEWRMGAGMAAYTASKAAVAALTVALAQEVVGDGILVNAIAPSTMDTSANRAAMPNADHATWAKVEDVAATILFLASPENHVTRGAVVPVYGRS